jgi:hypothetical protein
VRPRSARRPRRTEDRVERGGRVADAGGGDVGLDDADGGVEPVADRVEADAEIADRVEHGRRGGERGGELVEPEPGELGAGERRGEQVGAVAAPAEHDHRLVPAARQQRRPWQAAQPADAREAEAQGERRGRDAGEDARRAGRQRLGDPRPGVAQPQLERDRGRRDRDVEREVAERRLVEAGEVGARPDEVGQRRGAEPRAQRLGRAPRLGDADQAGGRGPDRQAGAGQRGARPRRRAAPGAERGEDRRAIAPPLQGVAGVRRDQVDRDDVAVDPDERERAERGDRAERDDAEAPEVADRRRPARDAEDRGDRRGLRRVEAYGALERAAAEERGDDLRGRGGARDQAAAP